MREESSDAVRDPARLRAEALLGNGRTLSNMGRYEEALAMVERAAEADPTYDRPLLAKGFVFAKLGRIGEGLEIVDGFIAEHPDNAYAHTTRGSCLMEAGRDAEAEEAFREGVRLGGEDYIHSYNFACFAAKHGREDQTREMLARALELAPHMNTRAATDPDFERFREAEWFQELVKFK
ncbi:MAG: tetratricopeptide repeat protein [Candidatus Coatesbacteria bacterium]|nr:MAG: tetratricopeptide repeat protein [Candidatus Coatesbacteria bacterium]